MTTDFQSTTLHQCYIKARASKQNLRLIGYERFKSLQNISSFCFWYFSVKSNEEATDDIIPLTVSSSFCLLSCWHWNSHVKRRRKLFVFRLGSLEFSRIFNNKKSIINMFMARFFHGSRLTSHLFLTSFCHSLKCLDSRTDNAVW